MRTPVLAAALLLSACTPSSITSQGGQGATGAITRADVIAAPTIASCTSSGDVTCRALDNASYPITILTSAQLLDTFLANGATLSTSDTDLGAPFAKDGGNAQVQVHALLTSQIVSIPAGTLDQLWLSTVVPSGATQAYTLPFELWPVHLTGAGMTGAQATPYSVDLGNWRTSDSASSVSITPTFADKADSVDSTIVLVVGSGTQHVSGSASFCDAAGTCNVAPFEISGPGDYTVGATGIALTSTTITTAPDMGGTSAPDMSPMAPVACGTDGLAPCAATAPAPGCAVGTVLDGTVCAVCAQNYSLYQDYACHPCGKDGEGACGDACAAGYEVNYSGYSNYLCHACGAEGQYTCNSACNPGFVVSYNNFSNYECHACGAEGQPQCTTGCDAGFTSSYNTFSDYLCHACGGTTGVTCN